MVMRLTGMMFLLLMGASTFTLVFRGLNGTQAVHGLLAMLPGGLNFAVFAVFAVTFCFGFFLDALEIVLLVVPIAMPPLLALGAPPLWITALMALTVQTSFLMPRDACLTCKGRYERPACSNPKGRHVFARTARYPRQLRQVPPRSHQVLRRKGT